MAKVTLQTLADRLGVSKTTVSNAFSRPDQLTPALRDKILAAARELNYSGPDPVARVLRRGKVGAVGVVFTNKLSYAITDPAALDFLAGISVEVESTATSLTLLPTEIGSDATAVHEAVVDGLIVYSVNSQSVALKASLARRIPRIFVDQMPMAGETVVNVDDRGGAYTAARHLLDRGHREFAIVGVAMDERSRTRMIEAPATSAHHTVRERVAGWFEALSEAGIRPEQVAVANSTQNDRQGGLICGSILLDRGRPTAILCTSDVLAFGFVDAARVRRLRVPEDISVVGFDDVSQAAEFDPPLTTVRQDARQKGQVAAQLLLAGDQEDSPTQVVLPTRLVIRGSTTVRCVGPRGGS